MDIGRCFVKAVLAGMLISMGGIVFLMYPDYKFIGALLFSVGLFGILTYGFNLYTGKVCYIFENGKEYFLSLFIIILGNFVGCLIMGLLFPIESAVALCDGKLCLDIIPTLAKGFGCGVMMFLAVDVYRTKNSYIGVFLCVPTFILAGFEHSIADMFYLCSAGIFTLEALVFIILAIIGNAIGGFIIPLCKKYLDNEEKDISSA